MITFLLQRTIAKNYLEIGVRSGGTFFNVKGLHKVAIDPDFLFDFEVVDDPESLFFPVTSDVFFGSPAMLRACAEKQGCTRPQWDVIFIDGLHTYEQSLRDFENSLPYSHDKTVWIIHDTLPSDPYSALPNMELSRDLQQLAGYSEFLWFGDVYKTVLAIHEKYLDFSYCTVTDCDGVPMTIVWKAPSRVVKNVFDMFGEIDNVSFVDLIATFLPLMNIRNTSEVFSLLGKKLDVSCDAAIPHTAFCLTRETCKEVALQQALCEKKSLYDRCKRVYHKFFTK